MTRTCLFLLSKCTLIFLLVLTSQFAGQGKARASEKSDDDILVRVETTRFGYQHRITRWEKVRDLDSRDEWNLGPTTVTTRFRVNDYNADLPGRQSIAKALELWNNNGNLYRTLIDPSHWSANNMLTGERDRDLNKYFQSIRSEIERITELSRSLEQDVEFMRQVLTSQKWYSSESYDVSDMRGRYVHEVTIKNEGVATRHVGKWDVYTLGKFEPRLSSEGDESEIVAPFELTNDYGGSGDWHYASQVYVTIWRLTGDDIEKIRRIIDTFEATTDRLVARNAQELGLSDEHAERYSQTTQPLLNQIFSEAYREALFEIVRHMWFFSGQDFPNELMEKRPAQDLPLEKWHRTTSLPEDNGVWLDGHGVPIIRDGAALMLPEDIQGDLMRIAFPVRGYIHTSPPAEINWPDFSPYAHTNVPDRSISVDTDVKHKLLTRRNGEFTASYRENEVIEVDAREMETQPGQFLSFSNAGIYAIETSFATFPYDQVLGDEIIVPAAVLTSEDVLKEPLPDGFHEVKLMNALLPATGELELNYNLMLGPSPLNDSGETWANNSTDKINIRFTVTTAGLGFPDLRNNRAEGAALGEAL